MSKIASPFRRRKFSDTMYFFILEILLAIGELFPVGIILKL